MALQICINLTALSAPSASMAPAIIMGLLAINPRMPFDTDKPRDHTGTKLGTKL